MTFNTAVIQTYDNNWIFGIVFGIFVYAGMGILLPELDKSIENSAQQGTSFYISGFSLRTKYQWFKMI